MRMKQYNNKAGLGNRITTVLLAVIMAVNMLPITAGAVSADRNSRLIDTSISLSIIPVHYIIYEYTGSRIDSRYATQSGNYTAWKQMNDSDKSKVTKWYAGFYSEMERQFGASGAQDMINWANQKNGWADAGNKLRQRLAEKNYPQLYEFYGDPDDPKSNEENSSEYRNRLEELSSYSQKEKEELSAMINDYNTAYYEGRTAYQRLIKLKQAQTNVAVTAISSDLIQIIVDNMIVSSPLSLPSSLDDLKDATIDFMDQALEISDTFKKTGLYKYTVYGVRDNLTGEDKRIDSKEAAQVIALYWKLLDAREDYAEAGYLTCSRMKQDLDKKLNIVASNDTERKQKAVEARAARVAAHKKALEEGVAYSESVVPDTSSVNPDKYYAYDNNGEKYFKEAEYNNARLYAAKAWAKDTWDRQYGDYSHLLDEWVNTANDISEEIAGIRDGCVYNITKTYGESYDDSIINPDPTILLNYDYAGSVEATEKEYEKTISALKKNINDMEAKQEEITKSVVDLKTSIQPYQNYLYSLCYGVDSEYGSWGLGDENWNKAVNLLENKLSEYLSNINLNYNIEYVTGFCDKLESEYSNFEEKRSALENNLKDVYDLYAETQRDIDYGMSQAIRFTNLLREKQESYPEWLRYHSHWNGAINANVKYERLYAELTKDCEFGSEQYRSNVESKVNELEKYLDDEEYYLAMITQAHEVLENGIRMRELGGNGDYTYALPEQCYKNINKMGFGGMIIKSYDTMSEEFGYSDYEKYRLGDKGYVKETDILENLIKDLKGESRYMDQIRALYQQVMEKRGDWLRAAKNGDAAGMREMDEYKHKAIPYSYFNPNFEYVEGEEGITVEAKNLSYTAYKVREYYDEKLAPIFDEIEQVYKGNKEYVPVNSLKGGNSSESSSDRSDSSISDDSVQTYNDIVSDDSIKTYNDAASDDSIKTNNDIVSDDSIKTNNDAVSDDSIKTYDDASLDEETIIGSVIADKTGTAEYEVIAAGKEDETVKVSLTAYGNNTASRVSIPKAITLEDGTTAVVTAISDNAFAGNKKLTAVNIPASVETIGSKAFKNCKKLKSITIPKNVTSIGKEAFSGDKALKKIIIKSSKIKSVGKNAFKKMGKNSTIKVPNKQKKAYTKLLKKAGFKGKIK